MHPHANPLREWIVHFASQPGCWHVTLHPNLGTGRDVSPATAKNLARKFLQNWDARMNARLIRSRWQKRNHLRVQWVAFMEGGETNTHWHLILRLPSGLKGLRHVKEILHRQDGGRGGDLRLPPEADGETMSGLPAVVALAWRRAVPSGTAVTRLISGSDGPKAVESYITKALALHYDKFVLSREFHKS